MKVLDIRDAIMDEKKAIKMLMKFFAILVVIMLIVHLFMTIYTFFGVIQHAGHETEHIYLIIQSLIVLELLYITINYFYLEIIDPRMLVLVVLTAVGREIIVTDIFKADPIKILLLSVMFFISIIGIKLLGACKFEKQMNTE